MSAVVYAPPVSFDAHFVKRKALEMRLCIVEMLTLAGSGHPGGSLSAADIVATLYFGGVLHYDPQDLQKPYRDRFILSKGHAAPVQYAALALAGFIDSAELKGLRKLGSILQGHPDASKCPGVEVSTGSLGQGLSIAAGLAQGLKLKGTTNSEGHTPQIYVLLGDGELQEGQVWEAAMYAAHYGLDNVTAIVDRNGLQIGGGTEDVMALGDVAAKFAAFGWESTECDGHKVEEIHTHLTAPARTGKPRVLVAHTTKGKGVSFMENKASWHGCAPSEEECSAACSELRATKASGGVCHG